MKFHHLIAIAAATCFAGVATAQTPPIGQPSQPSTSTSPSSSPSASPSMSGANSTLSDTGAFAKLDKDRDGSLTKKEATSNKQLAKQWDTLDANKDGKLDEGEFAQFEASGSASGSSSGSSTDAGASTRSGASSDRSSSGSSSDKPKY